MTEHNEEIGRSYRESDEGKAQQAWESRIDEIADALSDIEDGAKEAFELLYKERGWAGRNRYHVQAVVNMAHNLGNMVLAQDDIDAPHKRKR